MAENGSALLPRVSLIIVSWNALPLLKQCLPSVVATDYPDLEIILADNASTDGSAAWVENTFPTVKVVRHPENWLFCRGNNAALAHATGSYILLLNNDVEVPPTWLYPLVDVMQQDPTVGAVQPKLLQYTRRDHFEYAGAAGGFLDRLGYPFARGRLFFTLERDEGQYDEITEVGWATGAALLLRRAALDEVGLLDERFMMHMEEIDLCWRLWRHGYRVCAVPTSAVYHIGGGSLAQGNARKTYYNYRNNLLLLYKNLSPRRWRRLFPARLALDGLAVVRALLTGRGREALAILRAYRDAHRLRSNYDDERPRTPEAGTPPLYHGSVVIDYFLKRRRLFSELPAHRFIPSGYDTATVYETTASRNSG